jgi:hypothetical protein
MREKYFCPNCRSVITCGERYCGYCGVALNWVIPQPDLDPASPSHGARYLQQRSQQMDRPASQAGGEGQETGSSVGTMKPLNTEISKMLTEFEKLLKGHYNNQTGSSGQAPTGSN